MRVAEHIASGKVYAAKIISRAMDATMLEKEIANHQILQHKRVVELHEVIKCPDTGETVMIMEFVRGVELFDHIVRNIKLSETEGRRIFQQLILGLQHCHDSGVAHRDLKPENILLDEDNDVKIVDFGLSASIHAGELLTDSVGSPNYAAPELLRRNCAYEGAPVDIWAAGATLYALLVGELPFDDEHIPSLFKKIRSGKFRVPGYLSTGAKDLISRMLIVDAKARISLSEIRAHPWFVVDLPAEFGEDAQPAELPMVDPAMVQAPVDATDLILPLQVKGSTSQGAQPRLLTSTSNSGVTTAVDGMAVRRAGGAVCRRTSTWAARQPQRNATEKLRRRASMSMVCVPMLPRN